MNQKMKNRLKPNLLLIQVDQQRYDSLGCNGHALIETPNIDRLRREGMAFTNTYTPSPLCCPARQTLLSGVMPEVHGGLWNYDSQIITGLTNDLLTWTEMLNHIGFKMSYYGKWHVSDKLDPTAFGFDFYIPEDVAAIDSIEMLYRMPDNPVWPYTGFKSKLPIELAPCHKLAAQVINQIELYSKSEESWHIRLDFNEPHLPCVPSEPFASMYNPANIDPWPNFNEDFLRKPYIQSQQLHNWNIEKWAWTEWAVYLAGYFGIISQYDDAIGRVVQALENFNVLENTIIIFTTDHGDAAGSHRMIDKHYVMYEEEVHIPLIIRWPEMIGKNSSCDDFIVGALDLGPTILNLYGIDIPDSFQGISFLPQLRGEKNQSTRDHVFSSYHGQQFGLYDMRMVRDNRYKYIFNPTDTDEFYDLQEDPWELQNLAGGSADARLGSYYRNLVFETFAMLDDRLMTKSPWIQNVLQNPN